MKSGNYQVNPQRRIGRTISLPIWMEDYLGDRASKEGLSVSAFIQKLVRDDYDQNAAEQELAAAGGKNT